MRNKIRFETLAVGLTCVLLGIYWHQARVRPQAPVTQMPVAPVEPAPAPLALEQGESLIRTKSAQLASHPKLVEWLQSEDFIRRFVAAVDVAAAGKSPRQSLAFWRPREKFSVVTKKGAIYLDTRSYARYDLAADAFQSVNAQAAAGILKDLQSVFQGAYEELGYPNRKFKDTLLQAIQELLKTPAVKGPLRLNAKVISYSLADKKLEALSPAQKHLLRMGPNNTVKIQEKLREIAQALESADKR